MTPRAIAATLASCLLAACILALGAHTDSAAPRAVHVAEAAPPAAPLGDAAILLTIPHGADRAVWLDGVRAGLRTAGAATTFDVTSAACAAGATARWDVSALPLHDVPCPCAQPAEGRSCYLVRWLEAPAPIATR